jgi:hypothetical protein
VVETGNNILGNEQTMIDFVMQLAADRQYGTLAILLFLATATGYLFGRLLEVANACYHGRKSQKTKLQRSR